MKPTLDLAQAPVAVATFHWPFSARDLAAHFREIGDAVDDLGHIAVVVDLSELPISSMSLRKAAAAEMQALFGRCGARVTAVAHVVPSVVARAALATVQMLAPPPFPSFVTGSRAEAFEWVRQRLRNVGVPLRSEAAGRNDARVTTGLVRPVVAAARARGVNLAAVLATTGLSHVDLDDPDGRLAYGSLTALIDHVAASAGDPDFGLHAAEAHVDTAALGVVGFAARASPTLRDALDRTARYARLINENAAFAVTYDAGGARLVDAPIGPLAWPRHYAELSLATFLLLARAWTGAPFAATAVSFQHPRPDDISAHVRIFGCTPVFGAAENALVLPPEALALPFVTGDPFLAQYLDRRLDELARARAAAPGPLAEVRAVIARSLPHGLPTLAAVARELGVSERTLQRRLQERGVTFNSVLDSVRRDVALSAIAAPNTSVQEAAHVAGFSRVDTFRRTFRKWTGMSPREYRGERS